MTRRLNWVLLALLLLVGFPYYWLLLDNRPGAAQPKPVTIEQLRSLAGSIPGQAPTRIDMHLIAYRRLPGTLFAAGIGMKRKLIGVMVWQLQRPDAGPIVIDTGITGQDARDLGMESYDPLAARRTNEAMRSASMILLTHEHADHLGGLLALNDRSLIDKTLFSPDQLPGSKFADRLNWPAGPKPAPRLLGSGPIAVAPGVVVVPAPGHSPGSQLIFARLANGREYLFAGDTSTLAANWEEDRARSRLISDYLVPEDRAQVYAWLATIRALKASDPGLVVLPGHDFEAVFASRDKTGVHYVQRLVD